MITSIDTNVLIALWDTDDSLNTRAQNALFDVYGRGGLVICGAVFVELLGGGKSLRSVESFLDDTSIRIDWTIDEPIWRSSASAFQKYVDRRRKQKQHGPKRFVTDFLVGAHALENGYSLLTFDNRIYKAAFPKLNVIS
jgi:predicted nucleic acid-binding protein